MLPANLLLKLVSKREWVLMFLACLLLSIFMTFLLIFRVLVWIVLILSLLGLVFFGYKAFLEKDKAEGVGLEKTLQSKEFMQSVGFPDAGSKKKRK